MVRRYNSGPSAGRAANPRYATAPSSPGGSRGAGEPFYSTFAGGHLPILWGALLNEFGRTAEYWPQNDSSAWLEVSLLWKEGVENEERSPGRYSRATVRNSDIPNGPALGDALVKDGVEYDVVRVDCLIIGYSEITLQNRTEASA